MYPIEKYHGSVQTYISDAVVLECQKVNVHDAFRGVETRLVFVEHGYVNREGEEAPVVSGYRAQLYLKYEKRTGRNTYVVRDGCFPSFQHQRNRGCDIDLDLLSRYDTDTLCVWCKSCHLAITDHFLIEAHLDYVPYKDRGIIEELSNFSFCIERKDIEVLKVPISI